MTTTPKPPTGTPFEPNGEIPDWPVTEIRCWSASEGESIEPSRRIFVYGTWREVWAWLGRAGQA